MAETPWTELIAAARTAAASAYNPYSHYAVGAALLCSDGTIVTGCNIENASYGLTMCAERTAVFKAVSEEKRAFSALCICGGTADSPARPCGACRQVLSEFCSPDMPIRVVPLEEGEGDVHPLREYLPFSFDLSSAD